MVMERRSWKAMWPFKVALLLGLGKGGLAGWVGFFSSQMEVDLERCWCDSVCVFFLVLREGKVET